MTRHHPLSLSALVLALLISACEKAPEQESSQAIPKSDGGVLYEQVSHTWPAHNTYELDHQLVVRNEDPAKVMALLAIEPGMTVCDIGCGSGFYTTRLAEAAGPEGTVWAIDIQQDALDYLRDRLAKPELASIANVRTKLTRVDDCTLPPDSLDRGLLTHADFYAYDTLLEENVAMLDSVYRATKPGGTLVIVQDVSVVTHNQAGDVIARNIEARGFAEDRTARVEEGLNVYLRFTKPI